MMEPNQRVVYYKSAKQVIESGSDDITQVDEIDEISEKRSVPEQKLTCLISKGIDPEPFTSWKNGILLIFSETLSDLAIKLER